MSIHFGGRTLARSQAFQLLFQAEANHLTVEEVLGKDYVIEKGPLDEFARQLALGADAARHDLDAVIASRSVTWTLRRMPSMDRNLLRLAIYEMLFVDEVEIPVTINESVELAKAYGTDDSSRFVNGILGRLADDVEAGVDVIARAHEVLAERGEDEADLMAEPTVAEPAPEVADAEVLEPVSDEVYDDYEGGYEDDYGYEDASATRRPLWNTSPSAPTWPPRRASSRVSSFAATSPTTRARTGRRGQARHLPLPDLRRHHRQA